MSNYKKTRKILLTGATGQLGWELARILAPLGDILTPRKEDFNLVQPESLRDKIRDWRPDLIVNPAAYTAVDKAEIEHELAFKINAESPRVLAEEASRLNIPVIHYSTDYVFDGEKNSPYSEKDEPNPLNVYGESKLRGEQLIQSVSDQQLILRTSWIYSDHEANFLTTMLGLFQRLEKIKVVDDQIGAPTSARMLAEKTMEVLTTIQYHERSEQQEDRWGLYHLVSDGHTSWYGFAKEILRRVQHQSSVRVQDIVPIPSIEFPRPAKRPMNSRLDCSLIDEQFGMSRPGWKKDLESYGKIL